MLNHARYRFINGPGAPSIVLFVMEIDEKNEIMDYLKSLKSSLQPYKFYPQTIMIITTSH